jgi:peptidoglycan/xylan/chitin deacetylase (PgdA/CDA1 family)
MPPYLLKYPAILKSFYPRRLSKIGSEKTIYLSFDDGPITEVTPWVLDILKKFKAKASFFCIGENVQKHPGIFNRIIEEGHSIGNHTFNHLNGWKTQTPAYLDNIKLAEKEFQEFPNFKNDKLFRPPYGKVKNSQAKILEKSGYKIVMWDVLSGDFDKNFSEEKCLENLLKNTEAGSIVVFHDSLKAEKNLRYCLPKFLKHFSERGFDFRKI